MYNIVTQYIADGGYVVCTYTRIINYASKHTVVCCVAQEAGM